MQAVSKLPRLDTAITFSDSDLEGCQHPYDDPLVIGAMVDNKTIHRVLVDNGSSADIIFVSAFDKMGIERENLEPVSTHLRGFSGEKVLPLGSIQLVLTLGDPPCQTTTTVRFLTVDAPFAYNVLLSRPSLNAIKSIPSAYHMVIKFPTTNGVGMVRGDRRVARECYSTSMKQKAVDNIYVVWDPFPGPTHFGGSEPSPGCLVITQSLKIQSLRKRFQNLGKPINIYI